MSAEILAAFDILILDMNSTFMFGENRFRNEPDYAATYRHLGGSQLADRDVCEIVQRCFDEMYVIYEDASRHDSFPQIDDHIRSFAPHISSDEVHQLHDVFALHEMGEIPPSYVAALRRLSESHQLVLLSNLWAKKARWVSLFEELEIADCFERLVFSSDTTMVKPSRGLFEFALDGIEHPRDRIACVGDSIRCDIRGAKNAGLKTIWIQSDRQPNSEPDHSVESLLDLVPEHNIDHS